MSRHFSPQQAAAIAAATGDARHQIIPSVAGSGKTTVLVEIARNIAPDKTAAFCAFNKSISMEIEQRISKFELNNVKVGTLHSFGFGALRRAVSRVKVDANKLRNIARNEFKRKK